MDKIIVGIVALAAVVIAAMVTGVDGAVAMTGLSAIGGLIGYQVKVVKDKKLPGKVQLPMPMIVNGQVLPNMVNTAIPVTVPKITMGKMIDFQELEKELREKISHDGLAFNWATFYSYAHTRATAARIDNIGEAMSWNVWLLNIARFAFQEAFGVECPVTYGEIDEIAENWRKEKCSWLGINQRVVKGWVERLMGHAEALNRLKHTGIDWGKIAPSWKTAWGIGELAFNPIVHIGITSEDVAR